VVGAQSDGTKQRSDEGVHDSDINDSGPGTFGSIVIVCRSREASASWNDASRLRIAPMAWRAMTRRVEKLRPFLIRSTSNRMGSV
jgi:hypothetical protein